MGIMEDGLSLKAFTVLHLSVDTKNDQTVVWRMKKESLEEKVRSYMLCPVLHTWVVAAYSLLRMLTFTIWKRR